MCHAYDFGIEMDSLVWDLQLELAHEIDDSDDYYGDALCDLCDSMEDAFINALMEVF